MNVIVQADHIIPEEMAKIQNQVESRTVKTEMITNETTYSITSKISTTKKLKGYSHDRADEQGQIAVISRRYTRIGFGGIRGTFQGGTVFCGEWWESACKPGSVVDSHSSGMHVAVHLERPTREPVRAARRGSSPLVPLFGLAPGGVYPATDVATGAVRSYRTISPLPTRRKRI